MDPVRVTTSTSSERSESFENAKTPELSPLAGSGIAQFQSDDSLPDHNVVLPESEATKEARLKLRSLQEEFTKRNSDLLKKALEMQLSQQRKSMISTNSVEENG